MKRLLLAIFLTVFLASFVLATDVAYVVKTSANPILTSELNAAGLTYDVITEANVLSTNFSQYKVLLVGNDNFVNFQNIPVEKYNSLIMNEYHFYQKGIFSISDSQWGWSAGKGSVSSPTNVRISTTSTTITDNVPELFKAYTVQNTQVQSFYLAGKKATGIKLIAQVSGRAASDSIIAVAYPGTVYLNGKTATARSLFFGIVDLKYWTIESRQLFRNSLEWVLIGEDNDDDGFFTDEDCDDTNDEINPNGNEIEYDGIDQDCNGFDLGDFDGDNYCKEGYVIENPMQCSGETGSIGTDCNDIDLDTNPGSSNLSLNCVNDAPIISNIPNFIIRETQSVTVLIPASDPENDVLSYSINDSKFTKLNNNTFQWFTSFSDAGNHTFIASVSDGDLTSTKIFNVEVKEKNQPPILNETIPEQTWNEDTNHSLNLSDYFQELDPQDNLTYGVSKTSPDLDITVESIVSGIVNFIVKKDWFGWDWIVFFATDGKDVTESNNVSLAVSPVNDASTLTVQIPSQTWNEDTSLVLNLSKHFKDIDSNLTYTITGNSQINMNISGNIATLTPVKDWNGKETVKINANDGEFNLLSNNFDLTVIPVNDAPVLDFISDELILAGSLVDINLSATDIDGDTLTFGFSSILDSEGKWQTNQQNIGVFKITASVIDGKGGIDSQEFNIQVLQKFYINEVFSNPIGGNEWIEVYNGFNQVINLSNCVIKDGADNTFNLNGTIGPNGFAIVEMNNRLNNQGDIITLYCSGKAVDSVTYGNWDDGNLLNNAIAPSLNESVSRNPDGTDTGNSLADFDVFVNPTKGLASNTDMILPLVTLSNPSDNSLFTDKRDVTFDFTVTDDRATILECGVYLNNVLKATDGSIMSGSSESIIVKGIADGSYSWNVKCSDGRNSAFSQNNLSFRISAPDNPILSTIGQKSVNENETIEFKISATDQDLDNVTFSIQNAPQGATLVDYLNGTATFSWSPSFDQAGDYDTIFVVTDSSGLTAQETVKISVKDKKAPPRFSDIDICEVKTPALEITIKEPDEGEEFEFGEMMSIKAEVKNNHNEDLDVDVKVYLYDIDEEDVIENEKENSINIDMGKNEKVGFDLTIPEDLDENEFVVFVQAEGDGDKGKVCNEQFVAVDIQRKGNEIIITDVLLNQESVFPGDSIEVTVEMANEGSEDQDIEVQIRNTEMRINEVSEEFELEKFGDRDEERMTFTIQIPENAEEGDYDLEIKISSKDADDTRTAKISVLREEVKTEGSTVIFEREPQKETTQENKRPGSFYLAINLFLLMIVIIAIAIIIFVRSKEEDL